MKTEIGLGIQSDKSGADYASIAARAEECGIDVLTVFSDLDRKSTRLNSSH